jgi:hypothetical protein
MIQGSNVQDWSIISISGSIDHNLTDWSSGVMI